MIVVSSWSSEPQIARRVGKRPLRPRIAGPWIAPGDAICAPVDTASLLRQFALHKSCKAEGIADSPASHGLVEAFGE